MKPILNYILLITISFLLTGCPTTKEIEKPAPTSPPVTEKKPPAPEITFRYGTIDIGNHRGKIEKGVIDSLAATIRQEKIDVVSIQGIVRYPGLTTRVDFVDAFATAGEMRSAFGETIYLNGRQGGNAVYSTFPIKSNVNTHYVETQGNGFEAALRAVVDCGTRDVIFVSTRLPDNPGMGEETEAMSTFTAIGSTYLSQPIIISGNLPHVIIMQPPAAFTDVQVKNAGTTKIWYSKDGSLKVLQTKTEPTSLGKLVIVEFAIFRTKTP